MELAGKVAIVTGASRGIGRAVALAFIGEGAKVVGVARNSALLERIGEEVKSDRFQTVAADVSAEGDCVEVVSETVARFGTVDVLVNAAGLLGPRVGFTSVGVEEWEKVFGTNVTGVFILSRLCAVEMIRKKSGSIINVTSGVVTRPNPNWGAYLPSKFAVEGLTLMLSEELKEHGIRVNMIDPGRTRTDMIRAAYPEIDPGSLKRPEDITGSFVFLASDASRLVTGSRIRIK